MIDFPVNPQLSDEILARRGNLPLKPLAVFMQGERISIRPMNLERDVPLLFARTNGLPASLGERHIEAYDADALIWRYMSGGPFADEAAMSAWLQNQMDAPDVRALTIYDKASNTPIGAANLMSNSPAHLSIELGNIWYSPLVQRTGANTEATYLMLKHVFSLGYRRVIWKCDALNARSRRSALRFGFEFEGIHEQHFIVKNRNRDTAWFRMLDKDWDNARKILEVQLDALHS